MDIDGACHCGFISYRATINPQCMSICHCADCQMLTGSPYRVSVLTAADMIVMTGAAPKIYSKRGDNGRNRLQHFCGECGSPMFASGEEADENEWAIRWGSIRQRTELSPRRQIWCRSSAPWIHKLAELPARPKGSNDP